MRGRWLAGGSAVIAAATLIACASVPGAGRDTESQSASGQRGASGRSPASCGIVPTSSGPLAHVAQLAIKAPASALAGHSVSVSVTVSSKSVAPRAITTPATSALLVVRGSRVVGHSLRAASIPQIPLQLKAGAALPAQAIPDSLRLTGCGINNAALASGRYALVAVLGYELDSLNAAPAGGTVPPQAGRRSFALVSAPVAIIVS